MKNASASGVKTSDSESDSECGTNAGIELQHPTYSISGAEMFIWQNPVQKPDAEYPGPDYPDSTKVTKNVQKRPKLA
jgi:hypothetical protein